MGDLFRAKLDIQYTKPPVYGTGYDKTEVKEQGEHRSLVEVELTATSLEKLQEKLTAYVGLVEI